MKRIFNPSNANALVTHAILLAIYLMFVIFSVQMILPVFQDWGVAFGAPMKLVLNSSDFLTSNVYLTLFCVLILLSADLYFFDRLCQNNPAKAQLYSLVVTATLGLFVLFNLFTFSVLFYYALH